MAVAEHLGLRKHEDSPWLFLVTGMFVLIQVILGFVRLRDDRATSDEIAPELGREDSPIE